MRKTCNKTKKDDPNWNEKLQTECSLRKTFNISECYSSIPRVVGFEDHLILSSTGLNMSYSSAGLSK